MPAKALFVKESGKLIMHISDEQLADLVNLLEEETAHDHDYYIDESVIAYLEAKGANAELIAGLRKTLGARGAHDETFATGHSHPEEGLEVIWRELDSGE